MVRSTEDRAIALAALTEEKLELGDPEAAIARGGDKLAHWRWHIDADKFAWLLLDKAQSSTNTLSEDVMGELDAAIGELRERKLAGLVLRSAKKNGFVAGAEISDFVGETDRDAVVQRLEAGLRILDRLEGLEAPSVALIHGFCLGGGLELALACDYRIARDDAKLGFPEVMLGLHPGLAGTWRSLRHMDPVAAMQLMLTGKTLRARAARKAGLVDAIAPERHMRAAARRLLAGNAENRKPGLKAQIMSAGPSRKAIASRMESETAKKARRDHYPAPYALIDLWKTHGGEAREMRRAETRSFADLLIGETSQNLVRTFFLRERLKGYAKGHEHGVRHVHVIGAGIMGGDIAAWSAFHGFRVTLQDREIGYIAPAIKRAAKLFERKYRNEGLTRAALDRLTPDVRGDGAGHADLVIEAVPEDADIKHAVYEAAEARMRDDAILATNTSSLLLERLSSTLKRPQRFVGLHFFNPVAKMPLVEIVTHDALGDDVRGRALAFADAIDKLPLPVRSAPGFLVNRALTPYLMEALACYDEGIKPEVIDAAAEEFGMPMGPIELADQVGLDVCLHVAKVLDRDLDRPFPRIPDWLERKVQSGKLGRKSGAGIYAYKDGKPQKSRTSAQSDPALQDRLLLPLLDACVACLREGVVENREVTDAGVIFGTGFAPFRGGPMHYAETRGVDDVIRNLERLEDQHGPRFKPDKGWSQFSDF